MDALPVDEKTELDFASENPGHMHACGHDLHTAMLLGAASLLKRHEHELDGQVILMFQPGEETADGAKAMLDAGILDPKPDVALAIHIAGFEEHPTGVVAIGLGPVFASRDEFVVSITGKGGHGAEPHDAKNPIYGAVKVIEALTDMMTYEKDASIPGVLTVCQIASGSAANIIPETCSFSGTLRMTDEAKRQSILSRMKTIVDFVCQAYGLEGNLAIRSSLPMLINDDHFSRQLHTWLKDQLQGTVIAPLERYLSMGSDDFALIADRVPSVYLHVISQSPQGRHYPGHHEKVEFDDEAIPFGSAVYATAALNYLSKTQQKEEDQQ